MGIFSLFRKSELKPAPEHAVIVNFNYGSTDLQPIHSLGDRLRSAIQSAGVGEYDGDEVAADGADGTLYMGFPQVS